MSAVGLTLPLIIAAAVLAQAAAFIAVFFIGLHIGRSRARKETTPVENK